ncbi:uncharacterized protein LOC123566630 isoform X2 [Mercenaria mercenaria]|uniref:uncharacterized protein LOC123566630 isoform X2 n=1 Tax=Mercenaria mercenaria TaxID=6596 RepID=UPI00234F292B|nr:uncharacterized protein LOC123566630 isoform X2 [Mercenaria mercenaria]
MPVHSFVERQIECPICMDRFDTPRLLPCQHTFCEACLNRIMNGSTVRCPECREIHRVLHDNVSSFPRNVTIERLLDGANNYVTVRLGNQPHQSTAAPNPVTHPLNPTAPPVENQESQSTAAAVIETNNQTIESTPSNANDTKRGGCCHETCDCSCCKSTYTRLWRVLKIAVKNTKLRRFFLVFAFISCLITLSRGIAGFVKLSSDCKQEHDVAVFLTVKASLASFYWGTFFVLYCVKHLRKAIKNPFILIYLILDALFGVPWLCLGTYWVFGMREEIKTVCPRLVESWNSSFLDFSSFLIVVDWICFIGFLFFAAYVACGPETVYDGDEDEDSTEQESRGGVSNANVDAFQQGGNHT